MSTERCPHCGAIVKKENLRGHYERVHPKGTGSLAQPKDVSRQTSFVRTHRRRNLLVLSLIVLAVISIAIVAGQFRSMHIHPVVSATINGNPVTIPAEIGIDPNLYKDHSLDQYGNPPHAPLHTHDASGTVHVEARVVRDFTVKEFLRIWGQRFDASQVLGHPVDSGHRAYIVVDGIEKPATEDVVFTDGQRIQLVCGP